MSRKSRFVSAGVLLAVIIVLLVGWRVITNSRTVGPLQIKAAPLAVATSLATVEPVPIQLLAVGQVQSKHTVNIQPQVGGVLKKVYFTEGQHVHAGQLLFLIDPTPYDAALASAKAA